MKRKVAAAFVMLDGAGQILGYYTLSAYGIRLSDLPPKLAKKLPGTTPSGYPSAADWLSAGSIKVRSLGRFADGRPSP